MTPPTYPILDWKGGYLPKAFTHLGANMVATVLKSETAVRRAVQIIREFTELEAVGISSIQDLKQMMRLQNQVIIAINNQLQEMGGKQNRKIESIIQKLQQLDTRVSEIENSGPSLKMISKEEALILRKLVKSKCSHKKQITKMWSGFKSHFDINRYANLPQSLFNEALQWLLSQ